jgi:hypothetical protein
MNIELKNIIDYSYRIFSDYEVRQPLDACTKCCITQEEELTLTTTDVDKIPFELLYTYHTAAKPQDINVTEFKHFLPRYLDLTAHLKFVSHSAEIVLSSITMISDWTTKEKDILKAFGQVYFERCLHIYPLPENEQITSILIMLDNGNFNIIDYLSDWEKAESVESIMHFSDLINDGFKHKKPTQLSSAFAKTKTSKTISDWINAQDLRTVFKQRIENLILNHTEISDEKQTELSWAYDKL